MQNKEWVVSHHYSIWTLTRYPCESKATQDYLNLGSVSILHTKACMLGLTDTDFSRNRNRTPMESKRLLLAFLQLGVSSVQKIMSSVAFMIFESQLLYLYQSAFVAVTFKAILSIFTSIFFQSLFQIVKEKMSTLRHYLFFLFLNSNIHYK